MRLWLPRFAAGVALVALSSLAFALAPVAQVPAARDLAAAQRTALALLAQPRFQAPDGWTWHRFTNEDGAHLRYGSSRTAMSPWGTIVLLPGFQAPIEDFFETARDYQARGFDVWSIDFRGQGGSDRWPGNPQKAYTKGLDIDARDLAQFIRKTVRPEARGPVFIVAQSLGGHIALRAVHDHTDLARALVLSSPAISFKAESLSQKLQPWLLRAVARAAVLFGFGDAYALHGGDWEFFPGAGGPADVARDDTARALASEAWLLKNPALREGGMTWALVDERFRSSALELSVGWMQDIVAPVLIGTARSDALTDVSVTVASCRAMKQCQLLVFPHAKHALFGDSDVTRAPFIEASTQFLVRQAETQGISYVSR